jgi:hypothetical protein
MGFWSKLLGKKDAKLDVLAVDADGDGKVQDGTIWERPAVMAVDLDKTIEKVDKLLKEVAPSQSLKLSEDLEKAAKAQARAKKAAMTRAVNKAKKEAELAAQILEASKNSDTEKK